MGEVFGTGWTCYSAQLQDPSRLDEDTRKRVTRDGASDLLEDLWEAYSDPGFQEQVRKLAFDMHNMGQGRKSSEHTWQLLPCLCRRLCCRSGVLTHPKGVMEMSRALSDHTRQGSANPKLRERAEQVFRLLYGDMYEHARAPALAPENRAAPLAIGLARAKEADSD